jgi:TonB family protein
VALAPGSNMPPWAVIISLVMHLGLAGLLAISKACKPDDSDLLMPDMDVMMVPLPKASGRLPDRASRAPRAAPGADTPAPPKQSDPNRMRFEDPAKEKPQGEPARENHSDARQDLLRNLKRQQALDALRDAPIGDADRMATDPDSTLTVEEAFGLGGGIGAPVDPEAARYLLELRGALLPHWNPLPSTYEHNPDMFTVLDAWISDDGRYKSADVKIGSGNDSFDRSCLTAVAKAGTLPLPPDKFRVETRKGIQIRVTFRASDANR